MIQDYLYGNGLCSMDLELTLRFCSTSLTLGVHAQRGLQYLVVCVCVCVSVKSHLTSGVSVRPENTVAYSAGNGGQKICGVFFETAPFKSYGVKRK